ncbi:MAG: hypothetical protein WDM80_08120 [Limisphaerales bacterium]
MIAIAQKLRSLRLFQRQDRVNAWWQIILWWELRRFAFNLIVGATGILTCALLLCEELFAEKQFGDVIGGGGSPLLAIFGVLAYGITANICYTGGWICELFARYVWKEQAEHLGKIAFFMGIFFSVILTLTPVVVYFLLMLLQILWLKK